MTARRASRDAGFTLVELLVATAISSIVIAGGVTLLLSQQSMYRRSAGARGIQETARVAIGDLSTSLRRAALGVDSGLAFDFGTTQNVLQPQAPDVGLVVNTVPYLCDDPVNCRDRVDGPDEIVFYARDPMFGHRVTSASSAGLVLAGPVKGPLFPGQVLQVMCMGGPMYWVYVTVGDYVAPNPLGPVNVPLLNASQLDFPRQNDSSVSGASGADCFTDGTAWAAKVDRYRFFVQNYDPGGNAVVPTAAGARPYLMLDQGLSRDGQPLLNIIAPDVEDVQFAYVFPRLSPQVVGATEGLRIAAGAAGIDLGAASSGFGTEPDDLTRRNTSHPSNLRAVQVSLVVRSPAFEPGVADATVPAALNRPAIPGPAGYRRLRFDTTVAIPNMDARAPFYPFHSEIAGDRLNVGGS